MQQGIFFNNTLYRHLTTWNKIENTISSRRNHELTTTHMITSIFVVKSINKTENYYEFVFRAHIYAIAKRSLILWKLKHDFCLDSGTFMSLMNRAFMMEHMPHIIKHRTIFSIEIRDIEIKVHDNFKYVFLNFFFRKKIIKTSLWSTLKQNFI